MAYGLLLPNLTYNLFQSTLAGNFSPNLSFEGSSDFAVSISFVSAAYLSFNSSSDFYVPLQLVDNTPIIGTVEFFLTTHSVYRG